MSHFSGSVLPDPDLRVSDLDRSETVDRLAAHAAAGRLSVDELEQRLDAAYAAVRRRDLSVLEADLTDLTPSRNERRTAPAALWPVLALVAFALLASAMAGHPVGFPLLVAFVIWRLAARRSSWAGPSSSSA